MGLTSFDQWCFNTFSKKYVYRQSRNLKSNIKSYNSKAKGKAEGGGKR